MVCGAKLSARSAARAGIATRATVSEAPIAAAMARASRHSVVATGPGPAPPTVDSGPEDLSPAAEPARSSRSAQIAPTITEVAAIQVAQARLATQTASPSGAEAGIHAMMPRPYPNPS